MSASTRFSGADMLRASACLMVVLHHLAQHVNYASIGPGFGWMYPFDLMGGYGVAIFFVLSGFLLARPFWLALDNSAAMPSLRTYAIRRLARIVPGFWLACTVTFVLSFTAFGSQLDEILVARFLAGLLFISDWHWMSMFPVDLNGPLWSIGFEVSSYIFLPIGFLLLFSPIGRSLGANAKRLMWLAVIAITLAFHAAFVEWFGLGREIDFAAEGGFTHLLLAEVWFPQYNPIGFFAIFAIGALAAGIQVRLAGMRSIWCDLAFAACVATVCYLLWTNTESTFDGVLHLPYKMYPLLPILLGAILVLGPSTVRLASTLEPKPVRYIATISYGIYLWHFLIIDFIRRFVYPGFTRSGDQVSDPALFITISIIVVVLSFSIAAASWHWLEQPILRWAKGKEGTATRETSDIGDKLLDKSLAR